MIKTFIAGILIGVANIIPGVSGGTMAVSMGIYDKLIHAVTHLFQEFKKSCLFLLPVLIGAGAAIVALSRVIEFLFERYPLQTNLLFIGLIVGGLPAILRKVKGEKISMGNGLAFLLFFALVVGMALMGEQEEAQAVLTVEPVTMIKMLGVGVISAATMVIPGVSGSMMLMLMGYYTPVIREINGFTSSLAAFDMTGISRGFALLVPMGIGIVLGIFGIAKVIEIIFQKWPMLAYFAIIGLIVASPVAICLMSDFGQITALSIVTGVIALVLGFAVALALGGEE